MRSTEEIEEPSSPAITSRFPLISVGFQWFAAVRWGEKGGRPGRLIETDFSKATSGGGDLGMQEGADLLALKGQGRGSSLPGASGAEDVPYRSGHWMLELPRVAGGRWQLDLQSQRKPGIDRS